MYLDVAHERFYLYLRIFCEEVRSQGKKTVTTFALSSVGGEAVPFMCQDAEELGSTDACGEHQGSLFPFFFANKFEEILSLPPPRGDRVLLHLHTGCCLKSAVLF